MISVTEYRISQIKSDFQMLMNILAYINISEILCDLWPIVVFR